MNHESIYNILRDVVATVGGTKPLPPSPDEGRVFVSYGIDEVVFSEIVDELEKRFPDRNLDLRHFLNPQEFQNLSIGDLLTKVEKEVSTRIKDPVVVYVDDEEENLFVFKRKFGRRLKLETYTNPMEAFEAIKNNPKVALVITDEVMPGMKGNALCDEVRKFKPFMKFILITGNPENDSNLLHKSLRGNRFYEFISKPLDLEGKAEEYFRLIQEAMS